MAIFVSPGITSMEKDIDFKQLMFIASHFYEKGRIDNNKNLPGIQDVKEVELDECLYLYKKSIDDARKESPHHHTNRVD